MLEKVLHNTNFLDYIFPFTNYCGVFYLAISCHSFFLLLLSNTHSVLFFFFSFMKAEVFRRPWTQKMKWMNFWGEPSMLGVLTSSEKITSRNSFSPSRRPVWKKRCKITKMLSFLYFKVSMLLYSMITFNTNITLSLCQNSDPTIYCNKKNK